MIVVFGFITNQQFIWDGGSALDTFVDGRSIFHCLEESRLAFQGKVETQNGAVGEQRLFLGNTAGRDDPPSTMNRL